MRRVMKLKWLLFFVTSSFLTVYVLSTWRKLDFDSGNKKNKITQTSSLLHAETKQDDDMNFTFSEERNEMRIAKVAEICKALGPARRSNYTSVMNAVMDQSHRIAYCRVNKVASTYTMALLGRTFNHSVEQLQSIAKELHHLPYTKNRKIISDSYTFVFVREPYGRLFSTYSNKFYFPKSYWAPIGPRIVKRYRNNPSMDSLKYGHNITFNELIRYTVEEYEAGHKLDEHLSPMNSRCHHCDYRYDFIGKLETFRSDWTYLNHVFSTKKHINIPQDAGKKIIDFHEMAQISKTFDLIQNSTISRYKLYLRAWSYFQFTGRIYKHINMPFGEHSAINNEDFLHELEVAAEKSKSYAEETKMQKMESMKQAYASVPLQLLERLSKVVALDCMFYGYDRKPDWIFKRELERSEFHYFKGLE